MQTYEIIELIKAAYEAQKYSYAPYSHFEVGAALLSESGIIFKGCNIENAAYSPTNCAERTAFFKAVSEGTHGFKAIAIVGNKAGESPAIDEFVSPCGVCRQVMAEFCNQDEFIIILANRPDNYKIYTLKELLPMGFGPDNL